MLPASARPPVRAIWRRARRPLLLLAVPAVVVLGALAFWLSGGRYVTTENAFVKAEISQIASEISGRLAEVLVHDHQAVKAGDVLLRLEAEPYRLPVDKADAEVDTARAAVEAL